MANALPDGRKAPRRRGRPPQGEALLEEARIRLLREGVAMLTERGFGAVGLDEILGAAEVPKGSFYHYFGSKAEFGLALIDAYSAYFAKKLDRWFLDQSLAPLDRLRAFIEDARQGVVRFDFRRGCLVGNLGQEIVSLPESYRERLCIRFSGLGGANRALPRGREEGSRDPSRNRLRADGDVFLDWLGRGGSASQSGTER